MSGDVQGDTSKVISNQAGADINTDGNDKKILVEDGAEKQTDSVDEIKTISNAAYLALPDDEKKNYVVYNPSLQSMAFGQFYALQNQLINGFNTLGPAIDKMSILESISVLTTMADELSAIGEAFSAAAETIESLENVEIIGSLAKPVTSVVKMVGSLCALILMVMCFNPYGQIQQFIDAYDNIDFTQYKKLFESVDNTPSIKEQLEKQKLDMSEIHIPSEEIKNKFNQQVNVVDEQLDKIKEVYDSLEIVDSLMQTYENAQTAIDTATIGISFGTTASMKAAFKAGYRSATEKYNLNFKNKAKDIVKNINDFGTKLPIEYIKVSDLEKLNEMAAKDKKDSA